MWKSHQIYWYNIYQLFTCKNRIHTRFASFCHAMVPFLFGGLRWLDNVGIQSSAWFGLGTGTSQSGTCEQFRPSCSGNGYTWSPGSYCTEPPWAIEEWKNSTRQGALKQRRHGKRIRRYEMIATLGKQWYNDMTVTLMRSVAHDTWDWVHIIFGSK